MSTFDYLLTGFATLVVLCCWIVIRSVRRVGDGYEDALGFHGAVPQPHGTQSHASFGAGSTTPMPSASPFETQCVATRARASEVQSDAPFGSILGQESPEA